MTRHQIENALRYITEQFNMFGDSPWLEGWICGFTDPINGDLNDVYHELFDWLNTLRASK